MSKVRHSMKWTDEVVRDQQRPSDPVQVDELKPRRESLIEAAMEVARQGDGYNRGDVGLEMPLHARLEARPGESDEISGDIPVEAQRDLQFGEARVAPHALAVKQYEALKANLWIRYPDTAMKFVLFVGATASCGVSTAAVNFAATLAQDAGTKVLLIDANLRSPKTRDPASADSGEDVANVNRMRLLASAPELHRPIPGPSNLYVLPGRSIGSMSLSLFQSSAFDDFLRTVRQRFQYVVVDAPPLQGHPESLMLSRKADGVILVVESEKTRKQAALWTKQQIENAGGNLIGVVLNKRKYYIPNWLYNRI